MARTEMVVQVEIRDIDQFRLFVWELRQLADEMRVMASPHAERLENLVRRFVEGNSTEDRPDA